MEKNALRIEKINYRDKLPLRKLLNALNATLPELVAARKGMEEHISIIIAKMAAESD